MRNDNLLRETILRFAMVRHGMTWEQVKNAYLNDSAFHRLVETAISFYNSKNREVSDEKDIHTN